MKLAACTMAHRDQGTIRGTLACLEPVVDKHYVFLNDKPYHGEYEPPDDTEKICNEFPNVEVIKGNWEEHALRNAGLHMCRDCDWVLGFDADEMMTLRDLARLKVHLKDTKFDAVGFICKVYWRSPDYRFDPDPDHVKVCVIRSNSGVKYVDMQCVNVGKDKYEALHYKSEPFITHHHLSYAEPKDILSKVKHYNHANEVNGIEWYEKHFKNWKPGDPVYQPFGTKWEAVYDPLPTELRRLL